MLTAEQIEKNYNKHVKIIDTYLTDRKEKVTNMISSMEETYIMSPASGKSWYHNAFPEVM